MNRRMSSEVWRLQSFKDESHLNNVKVSVILLAREGYYLDHDTGKILCFSCGYEYSNQFSSTLHEIVHAPECRRHRFNQSFRKGASCPTPDALQDQVTSRHQNNEQDVAHLMNRHQNDEQDIPNAGDVQELFTPTNGSVHNSINGHSNQELLNNEQQQNRNTTQHPQNEDRSRQSPSNTTPKTTTFSQAQAGTARESASEHSTLNISSVSHPHFSTRQARIATFIGWSPAHSHRPDDFADLGFFYTGE